MSTSTLPRTPVEVETVRSHRVEAGLRRAWETPFFRAKLSAAGLEPGQAPDPDQWLRIPVTTKDELRSLSPAQFRDQVVVARDTEIATYWRSGGVTGRPLFYPKAHADLDALTESFARVLDIAGIQAGDLVHSSFPYIGVHPLGVMFSHALRSRGCGAIWAGAGGNTPTDVQVQLLHDLRPTAWIGIGSYINHLGHRWAAAGYSPGSSSLRKIVSSAEPLTPAKRDRMQAVWGAELYDSYGMTECSMMGAECSRHDGLHVWTDMFQLEVLDEETGSPVEPGETGLVVVTPWQSMNGIPFVRWSSGDIGRLEHDCSCAFGMFPRLKLGTRTVGFSKVRGVNINHNDLEDFLLRQEGLADYMVTVRTGASADELAIEVECGAAAEPADLATRVGASVTAAFEVRPVLDVLERGQIAHRLEGAVKQVRFRDTRGGGGG